MEIRNPSYQNVNLRNYLDIGNEYWVDNTISDRNSLSYRLKSNRNSSIIYDYTMALSTSILSNKIFSNAFQKNIYINYVLPFFDIHKMNRIGIDRVKLYVKLRAVDFEKYNARIEKFINENENNYKSYDIIDINTGEIKAISNFSFFSVLPNKYCEEQNITKYGLSIDKNKSNSNFILDITSPITLYNEPTPYNVTSRELCTIIENITKELEEEGIYIQCQNSNIFYLEINKNIIAYEPLYKKHSILKYLSENVFENKSSLYPITNCESDKSQTFTIMDNKMSITLYDKTSHLKNRYNLDLNKTFNLHKCSRVYRVEIKLRNTEYVNRFFKTNRLSELINIEFPIEYKFNSILERNLVKKIKESIENEYEYLYNLIEYSNFKHIREVYSKNQSKIFDFSIFAKAMFEKYKIFGNRSNFSKDFKKLMSDYIEDIKFKKLEDLEMLLELITNNKISLIDIPTNITSQINKFYEINNI